MEPDDKKEKSFFGDPRHKVAGNFAFIAECLSRFGHTEKAKDAYTEAAKIETELALGVHEADTRILSLMALSAISLWFRAGNYQAAKDAFERISAKGKILPETQADIKALLEKLSNDVVTNG